MTSRDMSGCRRPKVELVRRTSERNGRIFCMHVIIVVNVITALIRGTNSVSWLSIATLSTADTSSQEGGDGSLLKTSSDCDRLQGLTRRQALVCSRNLELMTPVRLGALASINECQYQFRDDRWNCPVLDNVNVFGKVEESGNREGAFLHAVSSAGLAHSVTKACSSGSLAGCGCDMTVGGGRDEGFEWSGCSDNTDFGVAFAQSFIDSRETVPAGGAAAAGGKDKGVGGEAGVRVEAARERALMNLHNNHVGRKLLEESREVKCKCHGVSGSCEVKTCFKALPQFRVVGDILRAGYNSATKVRAIRTGTRNILTPISPPSSSTAALPLNVHVPSAGRLSGGLDTPSPSPLDPSTGLVYTDESPAYCEQDTRMGSLGTSGRRCNATDRAGVRGDSCEVMCCGRGYLTRVRTVTERCQCKFVYCCKVECQLCTYEVEEYICR